MAPSENKNSSGPTNLLSKLRINLQRKQKELNNITIGHFQHRRIVSTPNVTTPSFNTTASPERPKRPVRHSQIPSHENSYSLMTELQHKQQKQPQMKSKQNPSRSPLEEVTVTNLNVPAKICEDEEWPLTPLTPTLISAEASKSHRIRSYSSDLCLSPKSKIMPWGEIVRAQETKDDIDSPSNKCWVRRDSQNISPFSPEWERQSPTGYYFQVVSPMGPEFSQSYKKDRDGRLANIKDSGYESMDHDFIDNKFARSHQCIGAGCTVCEQDYRVSSLWEDEAVPESPRLSEESCESCYSDTLSEKNPRGVLESKTYKATPPLPLDPQNQKSTISRPSPPASLPSSSSSSFSAKGDIRARRNRAPISVEVLSSPALRHYFEDLRSTDGLTPQKPSMVSRFSASSPELVSPGVARFESRHYGITPLQPSERPDPATSRSAVRSLESFAKIYSVGKTHRSSSLELSPGSRVGPSSEHVGVAHIQPLSAISQKAELLSEFDDIFDSPVSPLCEKTHISAFLERQKNGRATRRPARGSRRAASASPTKRCTMFGDLTDDIDDLLGCYDYDRSEALLLDDDERPSPGVSRWVETQDAFQPKQLGLTRSATVQEKGTRTSDGSHKSAQVNSAQRMNGRSQRRSNPASKVVEKPKISPGHQARVIHEVLCGGEGAF